MTKTAFSLLLTLLIAFPALAQDPPEEPVDPNAEYKLIAQESLANEQAEVRRLAVLALGAMLVEKQEIKAFTAFLTDSDPVIAQSAALALALRDNKKGDKALRAFLKEANEEDLPKLIPTLIRPLSEKKQRALLKDLLKKASPALQSALFAFIAAELGDECYELISAKSILKADHRDELIKLLSQHPRAAALTLAEAFYGSKDAAVRILALDMAANIDSHEALQLVAQALEDEDNEVAQHAEELLLAKHHIAIVPLLQARIEADPKDFESIRILTSYEPPNLTEVLMPVVEKDNPKLAIQDYKDVLALIAATKSEASHALLKAKIASTYQADRIAAAYAIGFSEDPSFATDIAELIQDGNEDIRMGAAQSLAKAGDAAILDTVYKALSSEPNTEIKCTIIRSLGSLGERDALNSLQLLVIDPDPAVKSAALDALAALGALEATTAIELVGSDPDPAMRWKVALTLFRIDPVVYGERLKNALEDAPEEGFVETLNSFEKNTRKKLQEEVLRGSRTSLALSILNSALERGREGLPLVRKAFDLSKDIDLRKPAFKQLATFAAAEDVDRAIEMLSEKDRQLRWLALQTLLRMPRTETIDKVFANEMNSDDPLFRIMGVYGTVRP